MSRIRSVHPGFFTDERLVSTSLAARLLFIGAGVEADDKGIFEWKPITLKMRLFPADNVDVSALLAELLAAGVIATYEIEGRQYGAIRNFRRHQRPKTPNDIHPIPDDFRKYVGLTEGISETGGDEPEQFPPKGEKLSQMEEGEKDGGKGKGEDGEKPNGFLRRASAQKPPGSGWIHKRTPSDAAEALIEDIERHDANRTEDRDAIAGEVVRLLPAVGSG